MTPLSPWPTTPPSTDSVLVAGPDGQLRWLPLATFQRTGVTDPPVVSTPNAPELTLAARALDSSTVEVSWAPTTLTDATYGRDGTDATGYGAWTSDPGQTSPQRLTNLRPATEYTITVTGTVAGEKRSLSTKVTTPAAPATSSPPATTTPVTPPTTGAPGTGTGTGGGLVLANGVQLNPKRLWPSVPAEYGWISGGSGKEIDRSTVWANRRKRPIESVSHWFDALNGALWSMPGLQGSGPVAGFKGLAVLTGGGPSDWGGTSLDGKVEGLFKDMRRLRTVDGKLQPTAFSFGHELNGNWYGFSIGDETEAKKFVAKIKQWGKIRDAVYPELILTLRTNGETNTGNPIHNIDWRNLWVPEVFDLYETDRYNQYPFIATAQQFADSAGMKDGKGAPKGVLAHVDWAEKQAKVPIGFPEWASNAANGDSPVYVEEFWKICRAGRVFHEEYFNQDKENSQWLLSPTTRQPKARDKYFELWGKKK